jgi:hypothetical protein
VFSIGPEAEEIVDTGSGLISMYPSGLGMGETRW